VSRVTGATPRRSASFTFAVDSSGHLTCTKCTSAASLMPASAIALVTASALASTCAARPISSGAKSRVDAVPMTSRLPPWVAAAALRRRLKTVKCGDSTPSVPPDITSATRRSTAAALQPRCGASSWHQANVANSRVWSLTQPLPSVLPITATISDATRSPLSMSARTPPRSPGPRQATRRTSTCCTAPCVIARTSGGAGCVAS
jgi:hypothetical protein